MINFCISNFFDNISKTYLMNVCRYHSSTCVFSHLFIYGVCFYAHHHTMHNMFLTHTASRCFLRRLVTNFPLHPRPVFLFLAVASPAFFFFSPAPAAAGRFGPVPAFLADGFPAAPCPAGCFPRVDDFPTDFSELRSTVSVFRTSRPPNFDEAAFTEPFFL